MKYRIKYKHEFQPHQLYNGIPIGWNSSGNMNYLFGYRLSEEEYKAVKKYGSIRIYDKNHIKSWIIEEWNVTKIKEIDIKKEFKL